MDGRADSWRRPGPGNTSGLRARAWGHRPRRPRRHPRATAGRAPLRLRRVADRAAGSGLVLRLVWLAPAGDDRATAGRDPEEIRRLSAPGPLSSSGDPVLLQHRRPRVVQPALPVP